MDQWLSDISQHCAVNIENHEVSRLTEILADINGTNENGDLDSMRQVLFGGSAFELLPFEPLII